MKIVKHYIDRHKNRLTIIFKSYKQYKDTDRNIKEGKKTKNKRINNLLNLK
jgi:hypothetical protein